MSSCAPLLLLADTRGDWKSFTLQFAGDVNVWLGLIVAIFAGLLAYFYYRRETATRHSALRWLLPTLRGVVVFVVLLMLTGPVVRSQRQIDKRSRVLVFVDASASMGRPDNAMPAGRKLLIAQRLGWLTEGTIDPAWHEASANLAGALQETAQEQLDLSDMSSVHLALRRFVTGAEKAVTSIEAAPTGDDAVTPRVRQEILDAVRDEVLGPAERLANQTRFKDSLVAQLDLRVIALRSAAAKWQQRLDEAFETYASTVAARDDRAVTAALRRFDQATRWQRAAAALLEGDDGFVPRLAEQHRVELWALSGGGASDDPSSKTGGAQPIWSADDRFDIPLQLTPESPAGPKSDLAEGMQARIGDRGDGDERIKVVLLTDGQHNAGGSPVQAARVLGAQGVRVHTVGLGDSRPPRDLAITATRLPQTVYAADRVEATVVLTDTMPAGRPFLLKVEADGKLMWEKRLVTNAAGQREVNVDFPIQSLVDQAVRQGDGDIEVLSLPLSMKVSIDPLVGEAEQENNEAEMRTLAVRQKRKVLLLDGRPRWETRYIRNLLERDKQWQVTDRIAPLGGTHRDGWLSDGAPARFPPSEADLFSYDLVIVGEVPRQMLTIEQQQWLTRFVTHRGGGLWFIDGRRGKLRQYDDLPLGGLFPVQWLSTRGVRPASIALTATGQRLGELKLSRAAGDTSNTNLWANLPAPHRVEDVKALPGAEVLVEARDGNVRVPALVMRRQGAGRVLYAGFDDSWRWRYEVADKYHEPYWKQVSRWMMETPFSVRDRFVSLGTEKITYEVGEAVWVRARLRDAFGRPVDNATAEAVMLRDGEEIAAIPLSVDRQAAGLFTGKTDQLPPGRYDVRMRVTGRDDADLKATTSFVVVGHQTGELGVLHCNEPLLRQVADASGGRYVREEDAESLLNHLAPKGDDTIEEREVALAQSYWLFVPLIVLLSVEWFVRKRAGLL